jgi:hypothetical protein
MQNAGSVLSHRGLFIPRYDQKSHGVASYNNCAANRDRYAIWYEWLKYRDIYCYPIVH